MKYLDADALDKCRLRFKGQEYEFAPATIKDHKDYFEGIFLPRLMAATTDEEERGIYIDAIRKYIPIPLEDMKEATSLQISSMLFMVQNGYSPLSIAAAQNLG